MKILLISILFITYCQMSKQFPMEENEDIIPDEDETRIPVKDERIIPDNDNIAEEYEAKKLSKFARTQSDYSSEEAYNCADWSAPCTTKNQSVACCSRTCVGGTCQCVMSGLQCNNPYSGPCNHDRCCSNILSGNTCICLLRGQNCKSPKNCCSGKCNRNICARTDTTTKCHDGGQCDDNRCDPSAGRCM